MFIESVQIKSGSQKDSILSRWSD